MLNLLFSNSKIHLLDVSILYSFVTEIKKNKKERKNSIRKKYIFTQ